MTTTVTHWKGRPIDKLSREELLAALQFACSENQRLVADRDRWREAGDPLKYLDSAHNV